MVPFILAIANRFCSRAIRRTEESAGGPKGWQEFLLHWRRTAAPLAVMALIPLLAAVPARAQQILSIANLAPMEGPAAGNDAVMINVQLPQGTTTASLSLSTDADWITILPGGNYSAVNVQNGYNRLRFQFAGNNIAIREGHITMTFRSGSTGQITVTQAGTEFTQAGAITLIDSKTILAPQAIDVDTQGNLYVLEVTGQNLFKWTAATQQTTILAQHPSGTFVDVAADAAGNVFALENTLDGKYGSAVEQIQAQGQLLPPLSFVFNSDSISYLYPAGFCIDPAGQTLKVTPITSSDKCLIDQLGTLYELDSVDNQENLGSFLPSNSGGKLYFPYGTYTDPCGNQLSGVSGNLYGLAKDGSGFIYFTDQDGTRLNKYDPASPWISCPNYAPFAPLDYIHEATTSFTTVMTLPLIASFLAADNAGNIYTSDSAFSQVQEIPRAYVSSSTTFNAPWSGSSGTIQVLPATQNLTGVFAPMVSDSSWITATPTANGFVNFSVSANNGAARTGSITVLGIKFPVTQAESQNPAAISVVSGNNQTAATGSLLAVPLLVKVTNQLGHPASNATVLFKVYGSGPTLTALTDPFGYASMAGLTLPALGNNLIYAVVPATNIFTSFNETGVLPGISVVSGSNQQVEVYQAYQPFSVLVYNVNGQPAVNALVSFTESATNNSQVAYTNSNGIATVGTGYGTTIYASGQPGSYVVTATVSGVPGVTSSSCIFNETTWGPMQALLGDQSAPTNNAYFSPLSVQLVNNNQNPLAGVVVTFTVGDPNLNTGAIFPDGTRTALVTTGANGIATAPPMTASSGVGTYHATATAYVGGNLSVAWTLTNLASNIYAGADQTGPTTRTFAQPVIAKASPGASAGTMVFTVFPGTGGAGGSFNSQNSVTVNVDSQGYAASPLLTANGTPGSFIVSAFDGVTTAQSTFVTSQCLNPNSATVTVANTNDYNPQASSVDTGSLRYAVANACSGATLDLTQLSGTIQLVSRLRLDDNMTIEGPGLIGGTPLALDGGSKTRLFFIGNGQIGIYGLTLQNGLAQGGGSAFGGGGAGMGGAIFMQGGTVILDKMTFTGNQALGGSSGASAQGLFGYGGGGFAGGAASFQENGGGSGDLFGLAGMSNGVSGELGAGGAGTGVLSSDTSATGGNGGFGAGGGADVFQAGETAAGNGGFGGGGGGGAISPNGSVVVIAGTGGYGGGTGYQPNGQPSYGGGGAGMGGAIFEYAGELILGSVQFQNNSAAGGITAISGQPALLGQGKGGALFIYNGAVVRFSGSGPTYGTGQTANIAAAAGSPGNGNSPAPYSNGATCPGQDTADICGNAGTSSASVTVNVPTGSTFLIDGVSYSGSQTLSLPQGQYMLSAPGPQATGAGTENAFAAWSDGGALAHTITLGSTGLSITGTFVTQYQLTVLAAAGGTASGVGGGWYNAGSVVNVSAAPNAGFAFASWTGPVAAAGSAATTVTLSAPQTVTASFVAAQLVNVSVPVGASFTLNGSTYSGPQTVSLAAGQYVLSAASPQSTGRGGNQQLVFGSWTDGGALSHSITVGTSTLSIGASFTTQYQVTLNAGSNGMISAASGFYSSGTVLNLTAIPSAGFVFRNWTGAVASPASATTTLTVGQAATVTANFWPAVSACLAAPANIAAWWKGDGTVNDETAVYNASLGGDVSFAPGLTGRAFSFDGTLSPYVAFPAGVFPPQPGNGAFSFETWFQTAGGNGGVILGQQSSAAYTPQPGSWSPAIYVGTDGNLYVETFYNGSVSAITGRTAVNDNNWHHVAVTYDGNAETVYLDGANIGQNPSFSQVPNGGPLSYQLGTGYTLNYPATNNGWFTFNGLIDEPTVYSRALSAAEVLSIAQAGHYGKCNPEANLNPGTLNFNNVPQGQSATLTSQVTNNGNTPVQFSSLSLDAGDTNFTVLSGAAGDCAVGNAVTPSGSCNVRVQYTAGANAQVAGQLTLTGNAVTGGGTQIISLQGSTQLIPVVTFTGPASAAYASTFAPTVTSNSGAIVALTSSGPCRVSGGGVTVTATTGTCQLQATWPPTATYAGATATLNVNATPISVTASVTAANKTFDGTTSATLTGCTLNNVLPADAANVSCNVASLNFAGPGAGSNVPVIALGITLTGSAASNYQLSSSTASTTASITFSGTASACVAAPAGLTAWWKGDNNASDATGAFNGTIGGDVSFAAGKVGQAFSFDGTQSPYVTLPPAVFPSQPSNGPFSFETWFQTTAGGVVMGQQSGPVYEASTASWSPSLWVGSDGKLYAQMFYSTNGQTPVSSGFPVNDGQWHHAAVTYDGSNENVYLDGGLIGTINGLTQAPSGSNVNYQLGTGVTATWAGGSPGWYTFSGLIDEPAVYSRALSATEVVSIAQAGNYGKCNIGGTVNPNLLSFGKVSGGQTASLTAVLSNGGNAPLTVSAIALDAGDTNFTLLSGTAGDCSVGQTVAAGSACNLRVQFAPQVTGVLNGTITITDNSVSQGGTQTVQLSGTGQSAGSIVLAAGPNPAAQGDLVTMTATVTGNPTATGNVTFSNGGTTLGTVALNSGGVATFTTHTLSLGTDNLTARYAGNSTYPASTSNTVIETVGTSAGAPTVVSVTPNAGSGTTQTFSAVYSDPNGAADLAAVRLLFNNAISGVSACYVFYSPSVNLLYLKNDAGTATLTGITPGSSATVSNSQCTLSGTGSSYTVSGNTATLNAALTFTHVLPENIYLAADEANITASSSGWLKMGTWGASSGAPTVVSVTPNAGSGITQTFSAVYSDPNGAADLATVRVLFNNAVSGVSACYVLYSPSVNLFYLENNGGTATLTGITPGSSATVSNSQCTLSGTGSSYRASGNTATLNLALTFTRLVPENIYLYAGEGNVTASSSGWMKMGTWGASAGAPTVVSVTPNAGSGLTQTFSAVYSDPNGASDLATVRLLFNNAISGVSACNVFYSPSVNLLYLKNDGGTATLIGITPGSSATVSNSQCTLSGTGSSYTVSGSTATLNVALTFSRVLPDNIYLDADEANITASSSGWLKMGTWGASAGAPTVVSVTPNAGSALAQTFSAVYSDPNGAADLAAVRLLFNNAVSGVSACYVFYSPSVNLLYLKNDAGTATLTGITPGSPATVSNSQCTLSGTGSSYTVSGNTATLNAALTFTRVLPENIYLAADEANITASSSGWLKMGTWGASAGAPKVVSVTPNSGSGTTQTFSAVYSDPNGAADLATLRMLFNNAISGVSACYVFYSPSVNLLYLKNDAGTATLTGITPGSPATVSNSQCTLNGMGSSYAVSGNTATLNVALTFIRVLPENIYLAADEANVTASSSGWLKMGTWGSAGPPTVVSVTPNSGSSATQSFAALYSDPNGASDLSTVRLLFNSSVTGANGCYVTYSPSLNLLYLENNGGTATLTGITPGSSATVSNSQCILSGTGSTYSVSGNTATLTVALTFTGGLPANIYANAAEANATAGNSGWVQMGKWL